MPRVRGNTSQKDMAKLILLVVLSLTLPSSQMSWFSSIEDFIIWRHRVDAMITCTATKSVLLVAKINN